MRKQYIYLFLIFLFFIQCTKENKGDTFVINLSNFMKKEVMLSEVASLIEYIPLESNLPFGHIFNIQIVDSLIFISSYPDGLHLFDRSGRYINKIGKIGYGPGEYRHGHKFTIDNKRKQVFVLDGDRVLKYSFNNEFIESNLLKEFNSRFNDIMYLNEQIFLLGGISMGYGNLNWLVLDTSFGVKSIKPNSIEQFKSKFGLTWQVGFIFENHVHYWNNYNDTVFQITKDGFLPRYLFAKDDCRLPMEDISWEDFDKKYFYPKSIFETRKFLIIYYYYKEEYHTAILQKKKKQIFIINSSDDEETRYAGPGITNDIDGGVNLSPFNYFTKGNYEYLVGWVFAHQLKAHVASDAFKNSTPKYPEKKRELERLANSLSENDNPVLMIVKLKE